MPFLFINNHTNTSWLLFDYKNNRFEIIWGYLPINKKVQCAVSRYIFFYSNNKQFQEKFVCFQTKQQS